jgi:hypothetical protein
MIGIEAADNRRLDATIFAGVPMTRVPLGHFFSSSVALNARSLQCCSFIDNGSSGLAGLGIDCRMARAAVDGEAPVSASVAIRCSPFLHPPDQRVALTNTEFLVRTTWRAFGGAGTDEIALHVGEAPESYPSIKRAVRCRYLGNDAILDGGPPVAVNSARTHRRTKGTSPTVGRRCLDGNVEATGRDYGSEQPYQQHAGAGVVELGLGMAGAVELGWAWPVRSS